MKCIEFADKIDDFIDDYLPRGTSEAMASHGENCQECRLALKEAQDLRQLLKDAPVPEMEQDALESMMRGAKREYNNNRRQSIPAILGAIAAGLVIFLAAGLYHSTPGDGINHIQPGTAVTQVAQISKTVNLLVNCKTDMEQAELTIILPENVELAGLPGQRQVTWRADLKAGSNLLPLDIITRSTGSAQITARVKHNQKSKSKILYTSI